VAVTTEPPWLNKISGTAPRNGTTSHTINFGFTSTSGSYLACFIHGAVTNTASGWTKQAGPVATGECALLTKTSTGDSSITVTHNGSNYAVHYVIYEFPAGTTLTGIDSTTGSNDTMIGLSGLPGSEQVVIGAVGRVAIGSETGASATWTAPWVEDGDLFVAASGTDGAFFTVGHQINVTAASITPTTSISYTGTWGNNQREKISVAFNVAASSSAVNGTATLASTSALTGAATVIRPGTATMASTSGLTAAATVIRSGTATMTSSSALTAAGTVRVNGTATLASTSTLTATTTATVTGTATLASTSALAAAGTLIRAGTATLASTSALTATGTRIVTATAALTSSSALTAGATVIVRPTAVLASTSALTAYVGNQNQPGQLTSGTSAATATGSRTAPTATSSMWP
jgi:fibronectin-binding autotransporter adhesin